MEILEGRISNEELYRYFAAHMSFFNMTFIRNFIFSIFLFLQMYKSMCLNSVISKQFC